MSKILTITAREILDSRGNPTVEATVTTAKSVSSAQVPSGASTGKHEAVELRDGDAKRFGGKGVLKACENVEKKLAKLLKGQDVKDQKKIDEMMIEADGTENKGKFGANAILAVSMACARARAQEEGLSLFQSFDPDANLLPVPLMNVLNGGVHADSGLNIQEFMLVPVGAPNFAEALRMGAEIFHTLGGILKSKGYKTTVGDEGGFAPAISGTEEAIELMTMATEKAGYKLHRDVMFALDAAASEFYDAKKEVYTMKIKGKDEKLSGSEMVDFWLKLAKKYPLISIEDGLAEDDWMHWAQLTERAQGKFQIVGDDLFVTNVIRLQEGIDQQAANSILIKLNQIGTVTETLDTIEMAEGGGFTSVISHRSGETEDTFIADLAVGMSTGQIKTGSLSRGERIAKYNQLLRIEQQLGKKAIYAGFGAFHNLQSYA